MASKRRAPGTLAARILDIVARHEHPLSALAIADLLRRSGDAAAPSLVFRALRTLLDQGAIAKLLVARAYCRSGAPGSLYLYCDQCGTVQIVPATGLFQAIGERSVRARFRTRSISAEIAGVCRACDTTPGTRPTRASRRSSP